VEGRRVEMEHAAVKDRFAFATLIVAFVAAHSPAQVSVWKSNPPAALCRVAHEFYLAGKKGAPLVPYLAANFQLVQTRTFAADAVEHSGQDFFFPSISRSRQPTTASGITSHE
jgi:hypothetical protein